MERFNFVGYVQFYLKITFEGDLDAVVSLDVDFSEELTYDAISMLADSCLDVYRKAGYNPIKTEFITKEEYEQYQLNYKDKDFVLSVSWDENNTSIQGKIRTADQQN